MDRPTLIVVPSDVGPHYVILNFGPALLFLRRLGPLVKTREETVQERPGPPVGPTGLLRHGGGYRLAFRQIDGRGHGGDSEKTFCILLTG